VGAVGQPGMNDGSPMLFDYGIQTEKSDIRCHVAPGTRMIFVFQTKAALSILNGKYPLVDGFQPNIGYATARGYLVPPDDIPGLRRVRWTSTPWWGWFSGDQSASQKGKQAVRVVTELIKEGRFPLWGLSSESCSVDTQKAGVDIVLSGIWRIQVKCDFNAGKDEKNCGTGNLFLQIAETNPLGLH